jgi:predicted RNase H-like HicB family nuclease
MPGSTIREYVVAFERAGSNYSAYVPDLPGCISTGKTLDEAEANIKEAISLYIDTLREDGQPIPEPVTKAKPVAVAA